MTYSFLCLLMVTFGVCCLCVFLTFRHFKGFFFSSHIT